MNVDWRVSGFYRNVPKAHLIYEDGEYLKARCGRMWHMSDAVTSRPLSDVKVARKCKRCAKAELSGTIERLLT